MLPVGGTPKIPTLPRSLALFAAEKGATKKKVLHLRDDTMKFNAVKRDNLKYADAAA